MPTVHLSLSDAMYKQLKDKSDEIGIQVTDLIKLYIKLGLQGGLSPRQSAEEGVVVNLSNRLDKLERDLKLKVTMMEGRYRQLEETLEYVLQRLDSLEDLITEVKAKRALGVVEQEGASPST
ncbi:MAG: hypothetical protein ACP5HK_02925 [Acidilobus sp.]